MRYTKEMLDKRICDIEPEAENTDTLREFIRKSEKKFCLFIVDVNKLSNKDLNNYIDFLDDLWLK